jgi:lipoprotein-anchoring transpeptidase ErfK/SrfK
VEGFPHRPLRQARTADRGIGRRGPLLFAAFSLLIVVLVAGYLYDHSRRDVIANGVRVAGVRVGGLTADQAFLRIRDKVQGSMQRPLTVTAAGRGFTLSANDAAVSVDAKALSEEALRASRQGSIFTRVMRGLTGGSLDRNIVPHVAYSRAAVRQLVAQVASAVNRPARDATVQPNATALAEVPSQSGRLINARLLGASIEHALGDPGLPPTIVAPMRVTHPHVTTSQLAARYPAYIVIDRAAFKLRFFDHLKLVDSYAIAVGRQGLETPAGLYDVQWKQSNPSWYVPKSAWAGALAGKVIPPGPQDPIKARWMAFNGGAGIHGIDPSEYGTIGHNASHGCVRMRIPDVIALYARSPVGTPVFVA